MTINQITSLLPRLAARRRLSADGAALADRLIADADAEAMAQIKARRAANIAARRAGYAHQRGATFAAAAYADLTDEQNPQGLISRWWDHGPLNLLLAGPARRGKTTAAYAIANAVHDAGLWVVAHTASRLAAALRPNGVETADADAIGCDLLLIDDLGREQVSDWWRERLHDILDERVRRQRRVLVTANATPDATAAYRELVDRYGTPIVERLIDHGSIITINGRVWREQKTYW